MMRRTLESHRMYAVFRAALLASLIVAPTAESAEPPQAPRPQPLRTGKERLGSKDSDEQRVDDCKVLPQRRTRSRPAACPWEFGS